MAYHSLSHGTPRAQRIAIARTTIVTIKVYAIGTIFGEVASIFTPIVSLIMTIEIPVWVYTRYDPYSSVVHQISYIGVGFVLNGKFLRYV
jgi:hypothetical protein